MKKQAVILLVYSTLAAMEQQDTPGFTKEEEAFYALAHQIAENPGLIEPVAIELFKKFDHMTGQEIIRYYERPDQQKGLQRRSDLPVEMVRAICHEYHVLQCKDCITKVGQLHENLSYGSFYAQRVIPSSLYFIDQLCPAFVQYVMSKGDHNLKYLVIHSCEPNPRICGLNIFDLNVITKKDDCMAWQKRAHEFMKRKNFDIEQVFVLIAMIMKNKADIVIAHNKACFAITDIDDRCVQPGLFYRVIIQAVQKGSFRRFPELNNAIEFLKSRVTLD